ncbi:MAG: L-threonylcarbamoyladenylate synthase [Candidatus Baltobacteraceae bacterium]|jgi:L-threonylcarbamoyladenylate synthase
MKRIDARAQPPQEVLEAVAEAVYGGGTVIFPTDTVYGIGCDPAQPKAIGRIFALKRRPPDKPLGLYFGNVAELLEYAPGNRLAARAARAFLPGPLTIVVARLPFVDERVSAGLPSVALRVPEHALCRAILERCGPLAATSANVSGSPAFDGANETELPAADLLVDDGPTPLGAESTVIDLTGEEPRLVREGIITVAMLERHLGPVHTSPARTGRAVPKDDA